MSEEIKDEKKVEEKTNNKKGLVIGVVLLVILVACGGVLMFLNKDKLFKKKETKENSVDMKIVASNYRMSGNSLENFDLYFMQLENGKKNMVYSPLSIKYALEMLSEGASGETKAQLDNIIGSYVANKYVNSANMSFGNAMFIRDGFKDKVSTQYTQLLKDKYSAEVILDSFASPANINQWINKKTLNMIPELVDDVNDFDFFLVNALAIDMEWINKITSEKKDYAVTFAHEKFDAYVSDLSSGYSALEFEGMKENTKATRFAAVANRYDIISELGEDKIKTVIKDEYNKWINSEYACTDGYEGKTAESIASEFVEDLKKNYNSLSASTDFYFHDDSDYKVFAKDLKEYNGTQLQYVGIMPKNGDLSTFISNMNAKQINGLIDNLKPIEMNSFDDKYITYIHGEVPVFHYDYELSLMEDLQKLGITDVFNSGKADLSKMVDAQGEYIDKAVHKATIDFSNDGIKAAAATAMGGKGSTGCDFDYLFDVPVKEIDLTFNKPYIYFVRDNNSGEVWFAGTVYEPTVIKEGVDY